MESKHVSCMDCSCVHALCSCVHALLTCRASDPDGCCLLVSSAHTCSQMYIYICNIYIYIIMYIATYHRTEHSRAYELYLSCAAQAVSATRLRAFPVRLQLAAGMFCRDQMAHSLLHVRSVGFPDYMEPSSPPHFHCDGTW